MRLQELLRALKIEDCKGDCDRKVEGLAYDSRAVKPGYLFVAVKGKKLDGHAFVEQAVERGAVGVVSEREISGSLGEGRAAAIRVPDARRALSQLAVRFYGEPCRMMRLVGITGTNGKTTTSYLLESILLAAGLRPGVIGTINYRFPGHVCPAPVTTPESLDLMKTLRKMADAGVTDVIMEVSSHALDQGRASDCPFRIGLFTNISRDHLDYHESMEAYFKAKRRLFEDLKAKEGAAYAVINADDPFGERLMELTDAPVLTYGLGESCAVRADRIRLGPDGLSARLITPGSERHVRSGMIGKFNVYNILAAAASAVVLGIDPDAVVLGIEHAGVIPGRLERVKDQRSPAIVVDYAHTPDALFKVLEALRPLVSGRLITVFGCGGDRDRGKRREMGQVAGRYSDRVYITSDNPRTEDPASIAEEVEEGVADSGLDRLTGHDADGGASGYILELDRAAAIRSAVRFACDDDLVLIAGKGHEDYQIIGNRRRKFDDREIAARAAAEKRHEARMG